MGNIKSHQVKYAWSKAKKERETTIGPQLAHNIEIVPLNHKDVADLWQRTVSAVDTEKEYVCCLKSKNTHES